MFVVGATATAARTATARDARQTGDDSESSLVAAGQSLRLPTRFIDISS